MCSNELIDLGPDAEVDQDQLVDRGTLELFQVSKAALSLLLDLQVLCLYCCFRPDVLW